MSVAVALSRLSAGSAWQWHELGDICRTTSGGTPSRKHARYFEGEIPWVKSGELPDGPVQEISESISEEALRESSAKLFPPGTLLMALYGATVGKLGVLTRSAATNQAVCAIFPPPEVDTKFLFWFLRSKRAALIAAAVGGAQPNISQGLVRSLRIPVPSMDDQGVIVAEIEKQFSRLDEAVANLRRVRAKLKTYTAAVLTAATDGSLAASSADLQQPVGNQVDRVPAKTKRTLALPVSWSWTTAGSAIDAFEAGASFKCLERPPEAGEVGVLKVSALTWGTYDEQESKTCIDPSRVNQRYMVKSGDFLFSRANTIDLVGACVIVGSVSKQLMLSDKTLRLRINPSVAPAWLQYCLRSRLGRAEIERLATGNQESMRNIGQERIRQIRIPLPPIDEQHRIVAEVDRRLSIVREVEAEVDANLKRAERLRQSTLARAFGAGDPPPASL